MTRYERMTYTRSELYDIWLRFHDRPDAVSLLASFANCPERYAEDLHTEFLAHFEAHTLDSANRGKSERERKHI